MSVGIDGLLEGADAGAPEGVEEALAVVAFAQIDLHQGIHRVGDLLVGKRRAEHRAYSGVFRARATQSELVELLALLIDAENADVPDVVVPAGVDAAADLDLQLADLLGAI